MTQDDFIELARQRKNIFLTGPAGSGKTYILNKFKNNFKEESKGKVVTVAPTGIAAINCGGVTIHSAFRIIPNEHSFIPPQKIDWKEIDLLIIDEISMVSAVMLDFIDRILRKHNKNQIPFGGLQVIIVGDPHQLPPVYNDNNEIQKKELIYSFNKYGGVTFDLSDSFKCFEKCELVELKRSTDNKLNQILNSLRDGNLGVISNIKTDFTSQFSNEATHIYRSNREVAERNYDQLLKLEGRQLKFKATITGDFNTQNCLAEELLSIKINCRIMVIKNLKSGLVNGDQGTVVKYGDNTITIFSDRLQREVEIEKEIWEEKIIEDGEEIIKGRMKQYPLKLGYAITGHKSQGLTIDKIVFHYKKNMPKELIYVGLSRATTFDNLYITK